jgi:hydroxyethylthiazole kinase-like uncharacterized protein yjeF
MAEATDRITRWITEPRLDDDKYSRGVLGVLTGSSEFPGAAVLGVEAAVRTGVGMVRYLGPSDVAWLVLQRRPEIVTVSGRVQAWLLGSGTDAGSRTPEQTMQIREALAQGLPSVVDAGALDLLDDAAGPVVITPHHRELARLLGTAQLAEIAGQPGIWAQRAAQELGVTVVLKGSTTQIAGPEGHLHSVSGAPGWLATAGSGDVLAGILGALLATHAGAIESTPTVLAELAETAVHLHAEAARLASRGAPIAALDIAEAIPAAIRHAG